MLILYIVLCWVVNAILPMTIVAIQQALAVEVGDTFFDVENLPDEDLLISVCAGLVTVHRDRGVVALVHQTTEEYFERKRSDLFPEAQGILLRTCLTILSFDEFWCGLSPDQRVIQQRILEFPFLAYAGKCVYESALC